MTQKAETSNPLTPKIKMAIVQLVSPFNSYLWNAVDSVLGEINQLVEEEAVRRERVAYESGYKCGVRSARTERSYEE